MTMVIDDRRKIRCNQGLKFDKLEMSERIPTVCILQFAKGR